MNSNEVINKKPLSKEWFTGGKRPFIIAGPCSAETEDQVFETASELKKTGKCDMLRAGIWKPRTRPGSFEGVGEQGLPWLKRVKDELGLPITVEVAKAKHVEQCLNFGIDALWIGARTTVNPFAVQEIADALRNVDIPVLIKNPINPDLSLWMGSFERMEKSGLNQLVAVHRGFSNLGETFYRNRPQWQIALDFVRLNPNIPLLCDPSHICGRRDILLEVSQKAMDLDYDGLMIESHIDPNNAWSDAAQQLTPKDFSQMIDQLIARKDYEDDQMLQSKLDLLREEIDAIDEQLFNLLSNRMKVVKRIGDYKKAHNMTIFQPRRWNEILQRSMKRATNWGLGQEFIKKYIDAVHLESINQQEEILKDQ